MVPRNFAVHANLGFCSKCSQNFSGSSFARASIFLQARFLVEVVLNARCSQGWLLSMLAKKNALLAWLQRPFDAPSCAATKIIEQSFFSASRWEVYWTCQQEFLASFGLDWNTPTSSSDQIFLIGIFLQIVACKLTNLSNFTPDKNLSCSEAGRRRLWSLVSLDKIW